MTLTDFLDFFSDHPHPTILLEGRRVIDHESAILAERVGALLANTLPHARFRSGNAPGSDEAFSKGVASVDPARLDIVAPNNRHRVRFRIEGARFTYLADLSPQAREKLIAPSIESSPRNKTMLSEDKIPPAIKAKAEYLLRDTLKVLGGNQLSPADAALFFIDPSDPIAGGTEHTIRVCQSRKLPVVFQSDWASWGEIS